MIEVFVGTDPVLFHQAFIVALGLALSAASSAASAGGQIASGIKGRKLGKKAERAQKAAIETETAEELRQLGLEEADLRGAQEVGYAASGVRAGVGTPLGAYRETRHEFARRRSFVKDIAEQRLKGAAIQGEIAQARATERLVGGAVSLAKTGASVLSAGRQEGWWGK